MTGAEPALHYVCTWDEASSIIASQDSLWVSNCGCRESRGGCGRSRSDVCLQFRQQTAATPAGLRPLSRVDAEEILSDARTQLLVARPFRGWGDRTVTEGICFCCDDCCGYFLNREEKCDRGLLIEMTNRAECNDCRECVDVCHFGARAFADGHLLLRREECHGCGLCAAVCPRECISMALRA